MTILYLFFQMNFLLTGGEALGKASKKCVSNFNFIISNPINSAVSHRDEKVKVI